MTATRTTIAGLDGIPQAVAGLDLRRSVGHRAKDAAMVAVTLAILLLVAL